MTDQQQLTPAWVVIPAAGIGHRMKSDLPKQYIQIHGKTLIEHTLDCFLKHEQVAGIIVAIGANDEIWKSLNIKSLSLLKPIHTVVGGSSRSESVSQGLKYLAEIKKVTLHTWVMVHDAARPCLSVTDLDALLAIRRSDCIGGLLASPVRDTMKRSISGEGSESYSIVAHTESRENLWHALTPQMFRLGTLQNAMEESQAQDFEITDESSAMEFMGEKPLIVECTQNNIKITHPDDVSLATFLLSTKSKSASGENA